MHRLRKNGALPGTAETSRGSPLQAKRRRAMALLPSQMIHTAVQVVLVVAAMAARAGGSGGGAAWLAQEPPELPPWTAGQVRASFLTRCCRFRMACLDQGYIVLYRPRDDPRRGKCLPWVVGRPRWPCRGQQG